MRVALPLALTLSLAGAPQAVAQPGTSAFEAAVVRARQARELGHLEEALAALEEAHRLSDSPAVLFNIAVVLRDLGRYAEGRDRARAVLARLTPEHPNHGRVQAEVDALTSRASRAWVRVAGGDEREVEPGPQRVEAHKGAALMLRTVEARVGHRVDVPWSTEGLGAIDVANVAAPRLDLDGVLIDLDRTEEIHLEPGVYAARVGDKPETHVTVAAGRRVRLSLPEPTVEGLGARPWIVMGVGVVATVVGAVLLADAEERRDEVHSAVALADGDPVDGLSRARALEIEADADTRSTVGAIALGLGVAAVAGGGLWFSMGGGDLVEGELTVGALWRW